MMDIHLANTLLFYVRIVLVVLPCPGYIHPDEFFQSGEPMASAVLNLKSTLTWEWTTDRPIRNTLHPFLSSGVPFAFLKLLRYVLGIHFSAALLVIAPRLLGLVNIHIIEKCLVQLSKMKNKGSETVDLTVFLFRSSYVTLIMLPRTFSNVLETILFSILLLLIMECAKKNSKVLIFSVAVLVAVGCFVRPTFVAFSVYPLLYLLQMVRIKRHLTFAKFVGCISVGGLVGLILMMCVDYLFYSVVQGRTNMNATQGYTHWLITPLNFFLYNTNKTNLSRHGTHPWYLHFTVNMMLLFAPMYLLLVQDLLRETWMKLKTSYKQWQLLAEFENNGSSECNDRTDLTRFLFWCIVVPLALLSFVPHQEPRFLLPLLVPLLLLGAQRLGSSIQYSHFRELWFLFNILCGVWFGFLHQGGVYKSLADMNEHIHVSKVDAASRDSSMYLVYWHTYMAPQHLLGVDDDMKYAHLINLGGSSYQNITDLVNKLGRDGSQHDVWLFCPGVLHSYVSDGFLLQRQYFPHVSTEDYPLNIFNKSSWNNWNENNLLSFITYISQILTDNLSLNGYQLLIQ